MHTSPESAQTFDLVGILDSWKELSVIAEVQSVVAHKMHMTPTHDCMRTLAKSRGNCTKLVSIEVDRKMRCAMEPTAMKVESTLDAPEANSVFHSTANLLTSSLAWYCRMPNLGG